MRRLTPLVAVLLLLGVATSARATGGYAPPQRVTPCGASGQATAAADGTVWGVLQCNQQLALVRRSPEGSWSSRTLPFRGYPRAVADDGRTTFFLFASPYDPTGENRLSIAKVPHGGPPSAARVLQTYSDETVNASLVAKDGRWWAVWDVLGYGTERQTYSTQLHQARTMAPAFDDRVVDLGSTYDLRPHLALRGSGAVLVATRGLGSDGRGGTRPVIAVAGADGTFATRDLGLPLSDTSRADDLLVAGSRTLLALTDGTRALLAQDNGDLAFTTRTVPTRAPSYFVQLAASYGRVFVAHSEYFTSSGGTYTSRAYVAEAGATGPFTTTEVSAPLARTNPAVKADLIDVTAVRGHATVLTTTGSSTWSQTQR